MGELTTKATNHPCYAPYVKVARAQVNADETIPTDDIEVDHDPLVRSTDGGVWVQACALASAGFGTDEDYGSAEETL